MPRPRPPSPAPTTPPRKPGRPMTDPRGPQRSWSVSLSDHERAEIVRRYGSLTGGVRAMYRELFARETTANPSDS